MAETSQNTEDSSSSNPPTTDETASSIGKFFTSYKKSMIRPAYNKLAKSTGLFSEADEDANKDPIPETVIAIALPVAAIGVAAAVTNAIIKKRRNRKTSLAKDVKDSIRSGMSSLKSLNPLSFGKRKSRKSKPHMRKSRKSRK
jgi:hypothetical protein